MACRTVSLSEKDGRNVAAKAHISTQRGETRMTTTIGIENAKDISVDVSRYEVKIDFNGEGTTRLETSRNDAELLHERLGEALRKI